jgi:hypothetical protein
MATTCQVQGIMLLCLTQEGMREREVGMGDSLKMANWNSLETFQNINQKLLNDPPNYQKVMF